MEYYKMRLTQYELISIKKAFKEVFQNGDIYLFGSRIDDDKKGGDIDLYIDLGCVIDIEIIIKKKAQFKLKLYDSIGEQKIDVVISTNKSRNIEKVAIKDGIKLNTDNLKIEKYFNECNKHIKRIVESYNNIDKILPMSASSYIALSDDEIKNIDQYLFRFAKLQDTIGDKIFIMIIKDFSEDTSRFTFLDILNKLEKIGILNNKDEWRTLREYRNDISHQYDDEPKEMAEAINNIFSQKNIIIEIYQKIKEYYENR
jgi:predicted nucleotidyltransferase